MSGKSFKRTNKELSPVLFEPPEDERTVYEVKREIAKIGNIRYDETTIFPGLLGRELPKTFGHYHPKNYPEIFEVLSGRAWWLMQRPQKQNPKNIEEIYLAEALEKEKVIMPPGFGFVSINPGEKKLVIANWVSSEFENDYETYENLRGAAYYILESADGKSVNFEKNSYYEKVPELVKVRPRELPKELKNLEFLVHPEKYLKLLTIEKCFKKI